MAIKPNAQACANLAMDEVDGDFIPYVLGAETLDGRGIYRAHGDAERRIIRIRLRMRRN